MEFKLKHFFIMNQVFIFISGGMFSRVWNATTIDTSTLAAMSILLIGLVGTYISFKGINVLFSRKYKKVN